MPRHRHLSRRSCLRDVPSLRADSLTGGIRYFDAQVDDARFSLVLARTAAGLGAVCVAGAGVTDFLHEGDRVDRGAGAGSRVRRQARGARTRRHQRHRRVDDRDRAPRRRGRPDGRAAVEGSAPCRRQGQDRLEVRTNPADGKERALRAALGGPLDHRHDRHRLALRARPPRGDPR